MKNLLNPGGKIIIGDVSFKTTLDLVKCKLEDNGQWDDDEIYIVFEEFEDLLMIELGRIYERTKGI